MKVKRRQVTEINFSSNKVTLGQLREMLQTLNDIPGDAMVEIWAMHEMNGNYAQFKVIQE